MNGNEKVHNEKCRVYMKPILLFKSFTASQQSNTHTDMLFPVPFTNHYCICKTGKRGGRGIRIPQMTNKGQRATACISVRQWHRRASTSLRVARAQSEVADRELSPLVTQVPAPPGERNKSRPLP